MRRPGIKELRQLRRELNAIAITHDRRTADARYKNRSEDAAEHAGVSQGVRVAIVKLDMLMAWSGELLT